MKLGYKYRIYLTQDQKDYMAKVFGCTRFIYNWGLRTKTDALYNNKKKISQAELSKMLTLFKQEEDTLWLQEVPNVTLQQSLRKLDKAFISFFRKQSRYPKFKNKFGRQSATYTRGTIRIKDNRLFLAKIKEPIKIKWSRDLPSEFSSATISKDKSDRYFISFTVEKDPVALPSTGNEIGIDLGITDIIVDSNGNSSGNPKFTKRYERKLRRVQQKLSRCKKGSKNRVKARCVVAKVHAKISDLRNDFIHKMTTELIKNNDLIVMEDLQVKNMIRNHCLAKSIADVSWGEIERQSTYKSEFYGREIVKIDKFFPSSRRCSACGFILQKLDLSVREWTCPGCDSINQRDFNAAKNILQAGYAILAGCDLVRQDKPKCTAGYAEPLKK